MLIIEQRDAEQKSRFFQALPAGAVHPRLLKPGYAPVPQTESKPDAGTDDELRARIESALYALMDRNS